ncbi:MAG: aldehyde dehydrogenase family protein, partial [Gluconacetobacter diazotrophicus]|nr:aldehyde dehydrogenase family protein [Gluconacetobacter diazotrophicus]
MPDPTGPDAAEAISRNPATGEVIAAHPFLSAEQVERALAANARAFAEWRSTAMAERVERYRRLASILRERSEHLAGLITAEMGKTIREARAEVEKSAVLLDWLTEHGPAVLADEPADTGGEDRAWVSFLPIGTVFAVMPWNLPIWQVIRASGPIMLSGNGFLLKHATNVIGCAVALEEAYAASGFPPGLFSSVNVDNAAAARIIADPRIAAVTLTGSVRAGAAVAEAAGKAVKKSLLELGGADAFIVLADADLDRAVAAAILSRFGNAGQVCLAAKRIIVERPVAEEFIRRFVAAARGVKAGDPLDPGSTIGPIARGDLRDGIHDQV